jgi:hypothetical protein
VLAGEVGESPHCKHALDVREIGVEQLEQLWHHAQRQRLLLPCSRSCVRTRSRIHRSTQQHDPTQRHETQHGTKQNAASDDLLLGGRLVGGGQTISRSVDEDSKVDLVFGVVVPAEITRQPP